MKRKLVSKVMALLFVFVLMFSLVACDNKADDVEKEGDITDENIESAEGKTVGISIWSSTDSLGKACTDLVKSAIEDMGDIGRAHV